MALGRLVFEPQEAPGCAHDDEELPEHLAEPRDLLLDLAHQRDGEQEIADRRFAAPHEAGQEDHRQDEPGAVEPHPGRRRWCCAGRRERSSR